MDTGMIRNRHGARVRESDELVPAAPHRRESRPGMLSPGEAPDDIAGELTVVAGAIRREIEMEDASRP